MKIAIVGAGAIGCWLGVTLARAGHGLSVVARGATLDAIRTHGLRLVDGGETYTANVQASESTADLGRQDLVIVAVKAPAMPSVADIIAPLMDDDTLVLTAMNGVPWWFCAGLPREFADVRLTSVDLDGRIGAAIPRVQTMGGVVHASCYTSSPGVAVRHYGNSLLVGEVTGQPSERAASLALLFAQAGIETQPSAQIQRNVWYKLWGNLTMNPISALTGATTDCIVEDPLLRAFATRVMLEAKEIGVRFGIPIDQTPDDRHQITQRLGAMRTSMLQDVEAGRNIELDAIVGAVRELGAMTGVNAPFTDTLFGLTRMKAKIAGVYF